MKLPKINIRREVKLIAMFVLAFSAIAFVEKQHNDKTIHEVDILIHDAGSNFFLLLAKAGSHQSSFKVT